LDPSLGQFDKKRKKWRKRKKKSTLEPSNPLPRERKLEKKEVGGLCATTNHDDPVGRPWGEEIKIRQKEPAVMDVKNFLYIVN